MNHPIDFISTRIGHPSLSLPFLAAGLLPSLFTSQTLSAIYFALLIPPAAWHCYLMVSNVIWPEIKTKILPVIKKILPHIGDKK